MPRKTKWNARHPRYVAPNFHQQPDAQQIKTTQKSKLRTSLDIYHRLKHDTSLGINLDYVRMGYHENGEFEEMPVLRWKMIEDGGDIPMHRVAYFVLYLDYNRVILWDKAERLDRLFCSGNTDESTQSFQTAVHPMGEHTLDVAKDDLSTHARTLPAVVDQQTSRSAVAQLDSLISIFSADRIGRRKYCTSRSALSSNQYQIEMRCNRNRPAGSKGRLSRDEYKQIAADTQQILNSLRFNHPVTQKQISIQQEVGRSVEQSTLYSEQQQPFAYVDVVDMHRRYATMEVAIAHESTLECVSRLRTEFGNDVSIALLNFASAKNPGGGWLTGSLAQEETIARASTLLPSLTRYQAGFYDFHRGHKSMLYSHALIYSPDILVLKRDNGTYIDDPFRVNVITSPAVNAGCFVKRSSNKAEAWNTVERVMTERCQRVLEVAMKSENEVLCLGAWGCGVFGNEPSMIARIFAELLRQRYYNVFRRVVFAILDDAKKKPVDNFIVEFENVFGDHAQNSNEAIKRSFDNASQ